MKYLAIWPTKCGEIQASTVKKKRTMSWTKQ